MLFDDQISLSPFFTDGKGFCSKYDKLGELDSITPNNTTFCRRQKHVYIGIIYQKISDRLHLLVDSTELKLLGEWKCK